MTKKEKLASDILKNTIAEFYKRSPRARFDDIPNSVFIDAMIKYGDSNSK